MDPKEICVHLIFDSLKLLENNSNLRNKSRRYTLLLISGCRFAKAILFASNIGPGFSSAASSSVLKWLCHQADVLPPGEFDLLLVLLYSIW